MVVSMHFHFVRLAFGCTSQGCYSMQDSVPKP